MDESFMITVQEMLEAKTFRQAELVAGRNGLSRSVKWVHILDSPIYTSLTGHEFILSTGRMFSDPAEAAAILKQIIDRNVSGVCIELVTYLKEIPAEMIRLAEEHNFPLIVFREVKSFIDITRDVNTMIIAKDALAFSEVEKYSQQLSQVLLRPHDVEDILHVVQKTLRGNLIYLPKFDQPIFLPQLNSPDQKKMLHIFKEISAESELSEEITQEFRRSHDYRLYSIEALDLKLADLYMYVGGRKLTELEQVIFSKTGMAIAQDLLRNMFVKEKKRREENHWIDDWCRGKLRHSEIQYQLSGKAAAGRATGYVACYISFQTERDFQRPVHEYMLHMMIRARYLFESEGFSFLGTTDDRTMTIILISEKSDQQWRSGLRQVIEKMILNLAAMPQELQIHLGVGKRVLKESDLPRSFQSAMEAIAIQKKIGREVPFFDDLHVYRLTAIVEQSGQLDEFINDYLQPVIQYDAIHHADLLKTLQVYLDCSGSKQKAAEKLFIVRQTLYLRIEKLEELLGGDFMIPEKRLAIEFALFAREYKKE